MRSREKRRSRCQILCLVWRRERGRMKKTEMAAEVRKQEKEKGRVLI